ncbi:MAG: 3-keto-disaccharide hydrolase [Bacteroidales bacterium]
MKTYQLHWIFTLLFCYSFSLNAQELPPPEETEVWEPVPEKVTPGEDNQPPSDAIVLFDGTNLSEWIGQDGSAPGWEVKNGSLTVMPKSGGIQTKKDFGSCQLHIEWRTPEEIVGKGQGRGNSGIFLMGKYEVQVLDSYNNTTYSNGQAGSIYKQHIPLVNACKAPGEWQSYDIVFMAPEFDEQGKLVKPATITVIHNGVLIQNHVEIKGTTEFRGEPDYTAHPEKLPLSLQDHNNPVSFRNIWIREL